MIAEFFLFDRLVGTATDAEFQGGEKEGGKFMSDPNWTWVYLPRRTAEQKIIFQPFAAFWLIFSCFSWRLAANTSCRLFRAPSCQLQFLGAENVFANCAQFFDSWYPPYTSLPSLPWRYVLPIPTFSFTDSFKTCCGNSVRNPASCESAQSLYQKSRAATTRKPLHLALKNLRYYRNLM